MFLSLETPTPRRWHGRKASKNRSALVPERGSSSIWLLCLTPKTSWPAVWQGAGGHVGIWVKAGRIKWKRSGHEMETGLKGGIRVAFTTS